LKDAFPFLVACLLSIAVDMFMIPQAAAADGGYGGFVDPTCATGVTCVPASGNRALPIRNPKTGEVIAQPPLAADELKKLRIARVKKVLLDNNVSPMDRLSAVAAAKGGLAATVLAKRGGARWCADVSTFSALNLESSHRSSNTTRVSDSFDMLLRAKAAKALRQRQGAKLMQDKLGLSKEAMEDDRETSAGEAGSNTPPLDTVAEGPGGSEEDDEETAVGKAETLDKRRPSDPHHSCKGFALKKKYHQTCLHMTADSKLHPDRIKARSSLHPRPGGQTIPKKDPGVMDSQRQLNEMKRLHMFEYDPESRVRPAVRPIPTAPVPRNGQWTPQHTSD